MNRFEMRVQVSRQYVRAFVQFMAVSRSFIYRSWVRDPKCRGELLHTHTDSREEPFIACSFYRLKEVFISYSRAFTLVFA